MNDRGGQQGKLFSCDVIDENGGETRLVFFNDFVDRYYEMIKKGGVYYVSKGSVKAPQKKQYCKY
jgi:replication factor A1